MFTDGYLTSLSYFIVKGMLDPDFPRIDIDADDFSNLALIGSATPNSVLFSLHLVYTRSLDLASRFFLPETSMLSFIYASCFPTS